MERRYEAENARLTVTPEHDMTFPDRRTAIIALTVLFVAGLCVAVYCVRHMLLIFILAIFFAYLIDPLVKFLQRHSLFFKSLRGPAVVEVYLALLFVTVFFAFSFAPRVVRNTSSAVDEIPVLLNRLSTGEMAADLRGEYGWSEQQESRLRFFLVHHKETIDRVLPTVDHYLSKAALILGWLFLVPLLAIFFLREGENIRDGLIQLLFPPGRRTRVRAIADELHKMLSRYMRAQALLCSFSFLFYSTALLTLRFPGSIPMALLGGLLEFVPAAGWTSTFVVIVGVGIVNHSHWVWMAALLGIWRIIQDYVIMPRVMGHELKIHPLGAIFAVLVGAELGGVVGIYLAIPTAAAVRVLWRVSTEGSCESDLDEPVDALGDFQPVLMEHTS